MARERRRRPRPDARRNGDRGPDRSRKKYEEFAYVLNYMPKGHPDDKKPMYAREPILQVVGDTFFTLLELIPKKKANVGIRQRIFIGKGPRSVIDHVKGRISYDELSAAAKFELPEIIHEIIMANPQQFVRFFNEARPLTTRMHQLELLPCIGKKLMWDVLNTRKTAPFKNFKDISNRVRIPDPINIIEKRIIAELNNSDKYRIFTRPPPQSPR